MNQKAQHILCIEARDRLKRRKRLTQAHYEAVRDAPEIPAESKKQMLEMHVACLIADAKVGGKKFTDWDRDMIRQHAPELRHERKTAAEYRHEKGNIHNLVKRRACKDEARRERLEQNAAEWMKYYLEQTFTRPWEKPHREIIKGVLEADETGGRFVVAAERGVGKSALLWGMVLFLVFTGRQRFPVCVPWSASPLKRAFRFWKTALCFNDRLLADYPEFCQPFAVAKGVAQRVPNLRWEDTEQPTGAQLAVGEGLIVLPDNLGCLGGATINGNIRGLNHPQHDGAVLRPTIALVDDVQDRGTAKSQAQINDTIHLIDGDVAACGQIGRDLPMLMACNCIAPHDVSEHYLDNPEWNAVRISCIEQWPDGWDDDDSEPRRLWEEWHDKFLADDKDIEFYHANKKEMTAGMKLSAPESFAGSEKCPDPFYGVIRMYFRMGHEAFMAERQQRPIDPVLEAGPYTITPDLIISRADKHRKRLDVPDWVTRVVASSDVNTSYALSSVVLGFGEDQTAALLWYGLHKLNISGDTSAHEMHKRLFEELIIHGRALAGLPCRIESWAVDGGGAQFDPVVRFAASSVDLCKLQAHAFTGRASKKYRPTGKTAIKSLICEQAHGCMDRKQGRVIRWVAWNADYWKEVSQRAWLGEIGSPGSLSLFKGNHSELAAQVCNEKLMGVADVGGDRIWNWHRAPGKNDFGDALAQGYALAAYEGIGTSGKVENGRGRKKYRQSDLRR